jgi:hypothetical protein
MDPFGCRRWSFESGPKISSPRTGVAAVHNVSTMIHLISCETLRPMQVATAFLTPYRRIKPLGIPEVF